jgi:nucleoside-diphosphate-sugar epimerase
VLSEERLGFDGGHVGVGHDPSLAEPGEGRPLLATTSVGDDLGDEVAGAEVGTGVGGRVGRSACQEHASEKGAALLLSGKRSVRVSMESSALEITKTSKETHMTTQMTSHVIIGAGPVGAGTARVLADAGHDVLVVTRSGSGPTHDRIECVAADAADGQRIAELAVGAHAIYNCANPPYSKWVTEWPPLQAGLVIAAETTGARLITMGNLYAYGAETSPMSATDPLAPPTRKGTIRSTMWSEAFIAHQEGRIQTTEVRASDFFGPDLGSNAHMGDRLMQRLLAGKSASLIGRPDQMHSWTYIGDVCDALAALGNDDRALGRAWHVPTVAPMTARDLADAICDAAGVDRQKVKRLPTVALRLAGLFSADVREVIEMLYQFNRPFTIDAAETTEVFGLHATSLDEQIEATIASYHGQMAGTGSDSSVDTSTASPIG